MLMRPDNMYMLRMARCMKAKRFPKRTARCGSRLCVQTSSCYAFKHGLCVQASPRYKNTLKKWAKERRTQLKVERSKQLERAKQRPNGNRLIKISNPGIHVDIWDSFLLQTLDDMLRGEWSSLYDVVLISEGLFFIAPIRVMIQNSSYQNINREEVKNREIR